MKGGVKLIQYKLYRIYDEDRDETLSALNDLFTEEGIFILNSTLIAIEYSDKDLTYRELVNKVRNLNLSQFIITSNYFIDIINYSIKNDYRINEIKFMDSIVTEDMKIINSYLDIINYEKNKLSKKEAITKLYSELNWISREESIDIQQVTIRYKKEKSKIYNSIIINNNGVITIKDTTNNMLKNIVRGSISEEI